MVSAAASPIAESRDGLAAAMLTDPKLKGHLGGAEGGAEGGAAATPQ